MQAANPDNPIPAGMVGEGAAIGVPRTVPAVVVPESAVIVGTDGPGLGRECPLRLPDGQAGTQLGQ